MRTNVVQNIEILFVFIKGLILKVNQILNGSYLVKLVVFSNSIRPAFPNEVLS